MQLKWTNPLLAVGFMLAGMIGIAITVYDSLGTLSERDCSRELRTVGSTLYDKLNQEIRTAIAVSKFISSDALLIHNLSEENRIPRDQFELSMAHYLNNATTVRNYHAAYVISDQTYKYYYPHGLLRIIDPEHQSSDQWYTRTVSDSNPLHVSVDYDEIHHSRHIIYFNHRIESPEHRVLGVAGIGLDSAILLDWMVYTAHELGLRVSIIDAQGVPQLDPSNDAVTSRPTVVKLPEICHKNEECLIRETDGWIYARVFPETGWHLVVSGTPNDSGLTRQTMFAILVIALITICTYVMVLVMIQRPARVPFGIPEPPHVAAVRRRQETKNGADPAPPAPDEGSGGPPPPEK